MAESKVNAVDVGGILLDIPDNIGVSFLPNNKNLSTKCLEKGLNYFTQGYIHNIRVFKLESRVQVSAKCWRSMRKNDSPHSLHIEISIAGDERITESYCSCKAGLSGTCSHVVGLVKSLQGFKLHNFRSVPDQQSCTSIPQQWHVPRGNKISPVPINHVVVARPTEERKRRPLTSQIDSQTKIPKVISTDLTHLQGLKGTPLEYMVSGEAPKYISPLGEVQLGSLLSYQVRNLKDFTISRSDGCGDITVPKEPHVKLPPIFIQLKSGYVVNSKDLEIKTRAQAGSDMWYKERSHRLTASNFGKVMSRKATPSEAFLKGLFNKSNIRAASLDYGRQHEAQAKNRFLKQNKSVHFHECGLVVNNEFPFLGASPDGLICENGESGLLEIKCPYSARNMTVAEACDHIRDFPIKHQDGIFTLRKEHLYYAQIQGQLLVCGAKFCEFVVYTQKDLYRQKIFPDIPYMEHMLSKLCAFFQDYALPFLARQNSSHSLQLK